MEGKEWEVREGIFGYYLVNPEGHTMYNSNYNNLQQIADKLNSYEKLKKERDELREMLEKVLKDNYNTSWSNANEFSPEGRYGELVPDTRDEIETILNKPQ